MAIAPLPDPFEASGYSCVHGYEAPYLLFFMWGLCAGEAVAGYVGALSVAAGHCVDFGV
ncbi:hypothetical protein [Corynebacterium macclintockiae]|uniref:hypothetical protein n=1 Tax=Corynebacterium macclintockiae TaxID=2913501 RepID=UPI003EBC5114